MVWIEVPAAGDGDSRISRLPMSVVPVVTRSRTWLPAFVARWAMGMVSVLTPPTRRADADPSENDVRLGPSSSVTSSIRRKRSVRGGIAALSVTMSAASVTKASREARIDSCIARDATDNVP